MFNLKTSFLQTKNLRLNYNKLFRIKNKVLSVSSQNSYASFSLKPIFNFSPLKPNKNLFSNALNFHSLLKFYYNDSLFQIFKHNYSTHSLQNDFNSSGNSSIQVNNKKSWRILLILLLLLGVGEFFLQEELFSALRFFRCLKEAMFISFDYKYNLRKTVDPEQKEKILSQIHQRSAQRLLNLCIKNGGIFIKLGQYLSTLNHLLPDEYTKTLKQCQNAVPFHSFSEIEKVFLRDVGKKPQEIFFDFKQTPIAAGSLAQVYEAYTKDNKRVAVKVQYPELETNLYGDLRSVSFIHTLIKKIFPEFHLSWLVEEFYDILPKELDFLNEGKNSEKLANNFKKNPHLYIPKIYWDLSTKRILVMEFVDGVTLNPNKLKEAKISNSKVAYLLNDIFYQQIFIDGFVHCDPHLGNVVARFRTDSNGKQTNEIQLVLYDHGVYRQLDESVRINYSHFWRAILEVNEKDIIKYGELLGAGKLAQLMACMVSNKTWDTLIGKKGEDSKEVIQASAIQYMKEITQVLSSLPRQILLIFKTNDILRAMNKELQSDVDPYLIMTKYCIKVAPPSGFFNRMMLQFKLWFYSFFLNNRNY